MTRQIAKTETGFTLIEILIAMTMLSVVVVSLLGLTYTVARRSYSSTGVAYTSAVLNEHVSRLGALPFDSVDARAGCVTVTALPFQHRRCITVANTSSTVKTVTVIVAPTNTMLRPDTVTFRVSNPSRANPFATN